MFVHPTLELWNRNDKTSGEEKRAERKELGQKQARSGKGHKKAREEHEAEMEEETKG